MQCDEFDVRWQKLLDLRRNPQRDPRLRRHAATCARCARQLRACARLLEGLELWEAPPLADDFAQRVVQQVTAQRVIPAARTRPARWLPLALAAAATLLIGVLPAWKSARRSRRPTVDEQVARSTELGQAAAAHPHAPSARAPSSTFDQSPWTRYGNSILGLYTEETRARHRQQVSEFAEDLRPIASPFNAALTAIRRTIPVNRPPGKTPPSASAPIGPPRASSQA